MAERFPSGHLHIRLSCCLSLDGRTAQAPNRALLVHLGHCTIDASVNRTKRTCSSNRIKLFLDGNHHAGAYSGESNSFQCHFRTHPELAIQQVDTE
jgi:hypothetical protein